MINSEQILNRMNTDQKINYDTVLQKMIRNWKEAEQRPKILIHSCCAPCSTYTLEYLVQYADITIYFANSNIHPQSEYDRRKIVQKEFVENFNDRTGSQVGFIAADYEPHAFMKRVKEEQLQDEPEGGKRCTACFEMRLESAALNALELNFDYFGSAITLSPKKNSQHVNEIGLDVQKIYDVKYLPSDFKKNNGYKRSIEMCKEYDIFRQCYCGCVFAANQQGIDLKVIHQEATRFLDQQ
jgi:predicted adenine nucleotide alpha hydrolase (AANH) superfamily ATPase